MRISDSAFLTNSAPARGGKWAKGLKVLAPFVAMLCLALWPMEASAKHKWGLEHQMEPYTAPGALKPHSWSGVYVGINGAWATADFDHTFNTNGFWNRAPGDVSNYSDSGALLGGHVGYNWQMGQWVVGIVGSMAKVSLERQIGSPFYYYDVFESEVEWIGSVTPRLGLAIDHNVLAYVKGGWAVGRVRDVQNRLNIITFEDTDTRNGWTIGGGLDYRIAPNWVVGVGYDYYDLGSRRIRFEGDYCIDTDYDFDVKLHTVTARLSYKFGSRPEPVPLK